MTVHHRSHLFVGFIGELEGQLNAAANSSLFDRAPITLKLEQKILKM